MDIKGKQIGIIRPVDGLGRIVVPKEFRKTLGIENGDTVEMFLHENGVFIKKDGLKEDSN